MSDLLERVASALIAAPPNSGPEPSELRARAAHRQRTRNLVILVAPAALLLLGGLVTITVVRSDRPSSLTDQPTTPTLGGIDVAIPIDVDYQLIEYRQESSLTCETPIAEAKFDTIVITAIADRQGHRWRNNFTYPDGTSRSLIVTGNAYVPDSTVESGAPEARVLGCAFGANDRMVVVTEPARGTFYSLNSMSDLPTTDLSGQPVPPGVAVVPTYRDQATLQDGDHFDSRGRPTQLWSLVINGSFSSGELVDSPGTETQEWWVDQETGQVLEYRFNQTIDGVGSATRTATLVESGAIAVDNAALDDPATPAIAMAPGQADAATVTEARNSWFPDSLSR